MANEIDPVLRLPRVKEITGKSRSGIYADIAANLFPPPIKIGKRAVGWRASHIAAWLDAQTEKTQEAA